MYNIRCTIVCDVCLWLSTNRTDSNNIVLVLSPPSFAIGTLADCNIVTLDNPIVVREDGRTTTQIGLLSYKDGDDAKSAQCYYWYDNTIPGKEPFSELYGTDQIRYYLEEVLGTNFYPIIVLIGGACILSLFVFIYVISYSCSTQVHGVRLCTGLFIGIIITLLQAVGTYLIYESNWCEENGCSIGRSTIFSIISSCCFFLSGFCFLIMSDYPGKKLLKDMKVDNANNKQEDDDNNNAAGVGAGAGNDEEKGRIVNRSAPVSSSMSRYAIPIPPSSAMSPDAYVSAALAAAATKK